MPFNASGTFTQFVARITTSHFVASSFVPARAPGPRSATKSASVSGPLIGNNYGVTSTNEVTT
jgi:hypothetical protein